MKSNTITYLNGPRLYRSLIAGIRHVISRQEHLNNINVFPVPDRDTGTNLALTLNSVIEKIYTQQNTTIHHLLDEAADSALDGARGNSGAIFAQFFVGLSIGAKKVEQCFTTKNFVSAVATASNYAHKALSETKEGTILTVIRDFSDSIKQYILTHDKTDFIQLLSHGLKSAKQSCENTAFQLKECKKAGVVDAGAQGFTDFLTGIQNFVAYGTIGELETLDISPPSDAEKEELSHSIDERYRYCTECLIIGDNIDQNKLRERLETHGNSLIVAGSLAKTKVHIHANDPAIIFDVCRDYGDIKGEKADDMIQQQHSTLKREQGIAILTDSGADFSDDIVNQLNIHTVPLQVIFDTKTYIDKVSINSEEFYQMLETEPKKPTTSQPSIGDFKRQYDYLMSHYESIIAIHLPKNSSGTINASQTAADTVSHLGKVSVIDANNISSAHGLIVMQAAKAASAGLKHDDILKHLKKIIKSTQFYMTLPSLDYAVQGGRVSETQKNILDFMRLKPILTVNKSGKIAKSGIIYGKNKLTEKLVRYAIKKIDQSKKYIAIASHSNSKAAAEKICQLLLQQKNISSCQVVETGAALGVHAGPGAIAITLQEDIPLPKQ